jgi:hypothetical protein
MTSFCDTRALIRGLVISGISLNPSSAKSISNHEVTDDSEA